MLLALLVLAAVVGGVVQLKGTPKVANAAAFSVIGSTVVRNPRIELQQKQKMDHKAIMLGNLRTQSRCTLLVTLLAQAIICSSGIEQ